MDQVLGRAGDSDVFPMADNNMLSRRRQSTVLGIPQVEQGSAHLYSHDAQDGHMEEDYRYFRKLVARGAARGVLTVHIKACRDFNAMLGKKGVQGFLRFSVAGVVKCTKVQPYKQEQKMLFNEWKYFSIERIPKGEKALDPTHGLMVVELLFFDKETGSPKLVGKGVIKLVDLLNKERIMMHLDLKRLKQVSCKLDMDLVLSYGTFGYGYSHQLGNMRRSMHSFVDRSLFLRCPPPEERTDPHYNVITPRAQPVLDVIGALQRREKGEASQQDATSGLPPMLMDMLARRGRLLQLNEQFEEYKTPSEAVQDLEKMIQKRGLVYGSTWRQNRKNKNKALNRWKKSIVTSLMSKKPAPVTEKEEEQPTGFRAIVMAAMKAEQKSKELRTVTFADDMDPSKVPPNRDENKLGRDEDGAIARALDNLNLAPADSAEVAQEIPKKLGSSWARIGARLGGGGKTTEEELAVTIENENQSAPTQPDATSRLGRFGALLGSIKQSTEEDGADSSQSQNQTLIEDLPDQPTAATGLFGASSLWSRLGGGKQSTEEEGADSSQTQSQNQTQNPPDQPTAATGLFGASSLWSRLGGGKQSTEEEGADSSQTQSQNPPDQPTAATGLFGASSPWSIFAPRLGGGKQSTEEKDSTLEDLEDPEEDPTPSWQSKPGSVPSLVSALSQQDLEPIRSSLAFAPYATPTDTASSSTHLTFAPYTTPTANASSSTHLAEHHHKQKKKGQEPYRKHR